MSLRRLPPDREAVARFVEELWLPYHRELESIVESHALADGVADDLDQEVSYWTDRLDDPAFVVWIAADASDETIPLGAADLLGFLTTELEPAPAVFDRPDRLVIGDLYVRERRRGTGLADRLVDRAVARARELGCGELVLDVDVDNERALAFYERRGFSPLRHRLVADVDEV